MATYPNANVGSIGSLLRMIAEEKSKSPIVPPSAQVASPIRGLVQEPLQAPEAPGTTRVVSVKPEQPLTGVSPEIPAGAGAPAPARSTAGPVSIGGVPPSVAPSPGLGEGAPAPTPPAPSPAVPGAPAPTPPRAVFVPPESSFIGPPAPTPAAIQSEQLMKEVQGESTLVKATRDYINNPTSPQAQAAFSAAASKLPGASAPTPTPTPAPAQKPSIGTVLGASTQKKPSALSQAPIPYLFNLATRVLRRR